MGEIRCDGGLWDTICALDAVDQAELRKNHGENISRQRFVIFSPLECEARNPKNIYLVDSLLENNLRMTSGLGTLLDDVHSVVKFQSGQNYLWSNFELVKCRIGSVQSGQTTKW